MATDARSFAINPVDQYLACVNLEYVQDLERAMVRVFVRLLGRIPTKIEYKGHGELYLLRQGSGWGDASAFFWDGKLVLLASGLYVGDVSGKFVWDKPRVKASWWVKEFS